MTRRFDLDWLRMAAFALLILYHIGMVFVPWGFHIKTAVPIRALEPLMLFSNAWRLSLLFLISGIASRAMLARGSDGFARSRSLRLLVPLLAGMALWVPPQAFVDVTTNFGYQQSFLTFWSRDYFRFDKALGVMVPTWNHLWFIAYLWVYTLILAALMRLPVNCRAAAQHGFDRLFAGHRLFVVPVLFYFGVRMALAERFPETHALTDDWCMHLIYGAAFGFGVGIGPTNSLWTGIARIWKPAAIAGVAGWLVVAAINIADTDTSGLALAGARLARAIQAWGMIIGLLGFAQAHWQRDHPLRATLSEAVFPAYIAHQTVLILVMFWIKPLGWPPLAEFACLLVTTAAGCWLFYVCGCRTGALRPLFGLASRRRPAQRLPVPEHGFNKFRS